jgi:glycosyltransferase involved in cell wall biosynthesis
MRIGVHPCANPHSGGIYQYGLTMLQTLYQCKVEGCADEFIVFSSGAAPFDLMSLDARKWFATLEAPTSFRERAVGLLRSMVGEGPHREAWRWFRRAIRHTKAQDNRNELAVQRVSQQFRDEGVELLVYPAPVSLAFQTHVPYVMAIHDLQHRIQPEFPEVSALGEWERREYLFRNGTRHATLLVADSEVGKEDILNFYGRYGVRPDQVKVLPFLPPSYLQPEITEDERRRVRARYRLPERYLFYPAQFWPHKNHKRIIQALGLLKEEYGIQIDTVFCGSHTGEIRERAFGEVLSVVSKLGLQKTVHYLGYVPNQDISTIYAEADGLVMPTFFGPTNIPILEAWAFGCPVLSSDIRGVRDQVRDAGILTDPRSVESIADGIYKLWTDSDLCRTLVWRGRQRLAAYTPAVYRKRLIDIIEEGKRRARDANGALRLRSI